MATPEMIHSSEGASRDILDGGDGNDIFQQATEATPSTPETETIRSPADQASIISSGVPVLISLSIPRPVSAATTIPDLEAGERIVITDDILSSFAFSVSGNTLNFTGGHYVQRILLWPLD